MKNRYVLIALLQLWILPVILSQNFTFHSNAPFGIQELRPDSTRAAQTVSFFDNDGDGDLDLFITGLDYIDNFDYWDGFHFFIEMQENTGDRYNPQFGEREELIGFPYPVGYFFVSPGDLNDDGKVDFVVGSQIDEIGNQKFLMLINTGTPETPSFDIINLDVFGLLDFVPESFFKPELTDLDGDGDLDLLASGFNSAFAEEDGPDVPQFYYAKNLDIRQDVDFVGWYPNPYGLTPSPYSELLASGDIDNDGDMDLIGSLMLIPPDSNNYLLVHLNSPELSGRPVFANALHSPYGMPTSFGEAQLSFPELADMDGDGDLDLFVFLGNAQGAILQYYENNLCQTNTHELPVILCEGETVEINGEVYEDAGEYNIHLQNALQCDSIIHLTITIETLPEVPLEATICEGESFLIGGEILTEPGDYTIILPAKNGCDTIVLLTLTIEPIPEVLLEATICEGESFFIGGEILTEPGDYTITLPAKNGCDTIVFLTLTIETIPDVPVEATICEGESFLIAGEILTEPGDYTITLPSKNGCDTIVLLTLNVNSVDPTVVLNGTTLTANETGADYQWFDCDTGNDIEGAISQSYVVTATGNYAVDIIDDLGCTAQSECTTVIITSTEEDRVSGMISVYPNPARHILYIKNDSGYKFSSLTLINSTGQLAGKIIPVNAFVDLSTFLPGVYLLKMEGDGVQVIKRFVIL